MKIFLDDIRNPKTIYPDSESDSWIIVRTAEEFKEVVKTHYVRTLTLPEFISFDHDLGKSDDQTGYDCAKWLAQFDMDSVLIADFPKYAVHSQNPVGAENIQKFFVSYLKHRMEEKRGNLQNRLLFC